MIGKDVRQILAAAAAAMAMLAAPIAFNACGSSSSGSGGAAVTGPVTGVTITPGNSQITLNWKPVLSAKSYDVYWSVDPSSTSKLSRSGSGKFFTNFNLPGVQPPFVHNGLHNGWIYRYCIVTGGSGSTPECFVFNGSPSSGDPCPAGASCQQTCGTSGQVSCDGACVNLASSASNCGACGNACAAGEICSNATCIAASSLACTAPTTNCNGGCFDLRTSASNCGACGNACPVGASCNFFQCACPEGKTAVGGACVSNCVSPLTACGSACKNLSSDVNNCGACGNVCPRWYDCIRGVCIT